MSFEWDAAAMVSDASMVTDEVDLKAYVAKAKKDNCTIRDARRIANAAGYLGFKVTGIALTAAETGGGTFYTHPIDAIAPYVAADKPMHFEMRTVNKNGIAVITNCGQMLSILRDKGNSNESIHKFVEILHSEDTPDMRNPQLTRAEIDLMIPGIAMAIQGLSDEFCNLVK